VTDPRPVLPIKIRLVEDDPGDVLITTEALRQTTLLHELHAVSGGEAALDVVWRLGARSGAAGPVVRLPRVSV
jgi:hypothetical protein